jgi:PDZ domain-containing protein
MSGDLAGTAAPVPSGPQPGDGEEPADAPPAFPLWARIVVGVAALLTVAIVAGLAIRLPYSTIEPGDAVALRDLVEVEGAPTFEEPRGDIRLLFVRERQHVNLWRYLQARLDDDIALFDEEELNPGGVPQEDLNVAAAAEMAQAKIAATKLALEAAGYSVEPAAAGLVVLAVHPSRPAGDVLDAGDVILSADGVELRDNRALREQIGKHGQGERVVLEIERDGTRRTVRVGVAIVDGRPAIGVYAEQRFDFPVEVTVDTAGIGGPSGGLAMTLAILDDLTPGNLTGGRRVAVTGTIDLEGNVGPIGGLEQKAVAARGARAQLFLVPQCRPSDDDPGYLGRCEDELRRAARRAGDKVDLRPVASFADALRVLREAGGEPVTQVAPAA